MNKIVKLLLTLLLIGNTLFCKHDKKGTNDLELLSILQMLSGFSLPGPKPEWTRLSGASLGGVQVKSITSDLNSNVYVTGQTGGNMDGQTITGFYDLFVSKYNSSGSKQWTKLMGVAGDQTIAYSITSDTSGNVYTVGETNGALDGEAFFGTPDFADRNFFIVKFDSNGNKQWTRLLGVTGYTSASSVTTDTIGNVYITGTSISGLDGQTFSGGGTGYFIAKYNSSGTKQWTKLFAGPKPTGIACDPNGKIYLTGLTSNMTTMDGVAVNGTNDAFLIQFDSNGNKTWTKLTGAAGKDTRSNGITTDSSGNIYLTGSTNGSIDDQIKSGGVLDLLIIKFDSSGNRVWTRQVGFTGNAFAVSNKTSTGMGIKVGKDQELYVSGFTNGNLDNQLHSDPTSDKRNVFLTKYDFRGNKIWTSITGQKGYISEAYSITTDPQGHPYLTGYTNGPLNGESLVGSGSNLFVIKY
ncbi:beta-propeller repeat protein [Leptospira santarosai str. HAI821]|uniref:SBBP repeat-containing protein n=1 Tax=Leptospira santarosai TaxID=28183 RepID=UPI0002BDF94F|nr:SBBP repeat-containing protein [Leptospira santarosai]EMO33087.1 beta-propeller repeat protein [Leptospira santarosai str. HAI821]